MVDIQGLKTALQIYEENSRIAIHAFFKAQRDVNYWDDAIKRAKAEIREYEQGSKELLS